MKHSTSSDKAKRVAILCNPLAGRGRALSMARKAEAFSRKQSWQVILNTQSTHAGHIENTLTDKLVDAIDLVILIGGDGTLRELLTGLRRNKLSVEIAFIPMGNANVVARELGIPLNPIEALYMLESSTTTRVDVGILTLPNSTPIIFLAMLEIGFGAQVVHLVNQLRLGKLQRLYKFWGDLVYTIAGIMSLIKKHTAITHIQTDNAYSDCAHIIVANMKTYAKGWSLTPDANCQDGLLDVAYNKSNSRVKTLTRFINAAKQKPSPSMNYMQLTDVKITSLNKTFMQIDGDPYNFSGTAHITVEKAGFIIHQPKNS